MEGDCFILFQCTRRLNDKGNWEIFNDMGPMLTTLYVYIQSTFEIGTNFDLVRSTLAGPIMLKTKRMKSKLLASLDRFI